MKYITRIGIEPGYKWAAPYYILSEIEDYVDNLKIGDGLEANFEINKVEPDICTIKKNVPISGHICYIGHCIEKDAKTREPVLVKHIAIRIGIDAIYYLKDVLKELEEDIIKYKTEKK